MSHTDYGCGSRETSRLGTPAQPADSRLTENALGLQVQVWELGNSIIASKQVKLQFCSQLHGTSAYNSII